MFWAFVWLTWEIPLWTYHWSNSKSCWKNSQISNVDCFTSIVMFTDYLWLLLTLELHLETSGNKEDCSDTRKKFERFWSASIRLLWSILRLKLSTQAHWFNVEQKRKHCDWFWRFYNNLILKELTFYGKIFKTHCFSNHSKNCLNVQMHSDAQKIRSKKNSW